ncbi:MAG TPA: UDP-glucose/GDP-mannose dehydrogenase family protein [Thermoanaerobaculia bacterium]|jgi:UDPglucose 6-dehydrogenase|nr:UDP-glucose/GDP-mannose dehydrogenase family protein [Thermoanaerobaculia bacterium]
MNICVVGSGYVGLVTGACLADFGMHVVGVDKDAAKVEALSQGKVPIYEPGLGTLVRKNMDEGRLRFSTDLPPAIEEAQAIFIAVGTPPKSDGSADLTFIREVAASISRHLNGYKVIVTKSTVPIGTGKMIETIVREGAGGQHPFAVVSNPEFLREGSAIEDFMHPDRVVIGSRDQRAIEMMLDVYSPLAAADVPFVITDVESAELIKYASNGFLATKISFINEVAELCEALGANVEVVSRGMGLDSRIGPKFLDPGPGFGGSCFPKDTRAVAQIARDQGLAFRIIEAVLDVNEATKARMVTKIERALGTVAGRTIAVLGLSFKPNTDDVRESPALPIVQGLLDGHANVRAFDPEAMPACAPLFPGVRFCDNAYEAARGADALVICTEWNQFRKLELDRLHALLRRPLVIDLRNLYAPEKMAAANFEYISIGRPTARPGMPAGAAGMAGTEAATPAAAAPSPAAAPASASAAASVAAPQEPQRTVAAAARPRAPEEAPA